VTTTVKLIALSLCLALTASCATVNVSEPKGAPQTQAYPPVIEASGAREQAAGEAWSKFLAGRRLDYAPPDFEPTLYAPRALPAALAGRISIRPESGEGGAPGGVNDALDEMKAKNLLRAFIERERVLLTGDGASALTLRDLSLAAFSADANTYRAVYRQVNFPFPVANGYGELRLVISKTGALLQLSSRLLPPVELQTPPALDRAAVTEKLIGREFTYTSVAGQPLSYKVTDAEDVVIRDLVVYPQPEQGRLTLRLAYPVEVGRGTTWTIYVDAVGGQEIAVKPNFVS
jgi:hypothetical protein